MPPKAIKTSTSAQPLIRPVLQAASSPARADSPAVEGGASAASALNIASLKTELVRAVVSEMQIILNDHHSKLRTELLEIKAELSRDFAALKTEFVTMKNTVSDMEHSLSTCTDETAALQAKVEHLSKDMQALQDKCEDLEARSRRQNVRIIGIPEDDTFALSTTAVSALLKEAFDLEKLPLVERAHRSLAPKPRPGAPPRPVIARLHNYEDCANILQSAKRKQRVKVRNMALSVFPDFTAKTARARAAFNEVRRELRSMNGVKYGLFYPARLRITQDGKHHDFTSPEDAKKFISTLVK